MFLVDGSDRKRLKIPVFETMVRDRHHEFTKLGPDTRVTMFPQPNHYDLKARRSFQLFANLFQSFFEMAIIVLGLYRLRQFFYFSEGQFIFLSIGPVCIVLEIIGALLRLAYTTVDPFYTYRMMPETASYILVTISFPFTLSAGILLTFFCTYSPLQRPSGDAVSRECHSKKKILGEKSHQRPKIPNRNNIKREWDGWC